MQEFPNLKKWHSWPFHIVGCECGFLGSICLVLSASVPYYYSCKQQCEMCSYNITLSWSVM